MVTRQTTATLISYSTGNSRSCSSHTLMALYHRHPTHPHPHRPLPSWQMALGGAVTIRWTPTFRRRPTRRTLSRGTSSSCRRQCHQRLSTEPVVVQWWWAGRSYSWSMHSISPSSLSSMRYLCCWCSECSLSLYLFSLLSLALFGSSLVLLDTLTNTHAHSHNTLLTYTSFAPRPLSPL